MLSMQEETKVLEDKKFCACGCGQLMPVPRYLSWTRRFIHGHNWRNKKRDTKGWKLSEQGYVMIYEPNYPYGKKDGWVKEHRLVWETFNNAILCKWTDVHHINGIRHDNRIENLQALIHGKHTALHKSKGVT